MWDIKVKATNKAKKQKKTHRQRQQYGSYQWEWVLGAWLGKGRGHQGFSDRRLVLGW